jgi:hypothetical protein
MAPGANWLSVAPNPFTTDLAATITLSAGGLVVFTITDMAGRTICCSQQMCAPGSTSISLSLPGLIPGIYLLKAVAPAASQTVKIVKE